MGMVVALVLYGLTATLVASLGSSHRHVSARAASEPTALVLVDFRRTGQIGISSVRHEAHPHSHSLLQRHHHDATDTTVLAVDGAASNDSLAGDAGATTLVSMVLIAPAAAGIGVPEPLGQVLRRHAPGQPPVPSGHSRLPERPPRA